ncbi:MAG TPA: multifunctional oxoglutarate decarboxylase/oxoglutarate dehydrogenase thiamine pyrophosphate-binding subunit/dihydrolipoyllysine-residue succinyltransferase subunit, partial [Acidimicrobiales bacterium]|nr:multifunctional oxoglutarate decarboxylase/oxoglutarate dehydrogenase thiamine pyrophosphate-binding subunit/dihydrolipoyllysine-residue succinyltransferase subunit [Acidimicrobiales bacterium]
MTVGSPKDTDEPRIAPDPVDALGINAWLVEEMYQEYRVNPLSVSDSWRDLFSTPSFRPDDRSQNGREKAVEPNGVTAEMASPMTASVDVSPKLVAETERKVAAPALSAAPAPAPTPLAQQAPVQVDGDVMVLRGVPARIAENMVASLGVPTATSVHPVPAKLLEVNRSILNDELQRSGREKVSFTHLIGWAVVRALGDVPALNATYLDDADGKGAPGVARHKHIGLGIAIDLARPDGSRTLVVPVIKQADTLDFRGFRAAYESLVAKARAGKLEVDDFAGATVTITNPGTLGTTQSVPRLMRGQGAIIGVGALDYPAEFQLAAPETIAALGVGKVVTLTSTYDHRIIQGAESGLFLRRVHELLVGADAFYDDAFASLGVLREPVRWARDEQYASGDDAQTRKELKVQSLINMYRVRGHLIAHLDPLQTEPPKLHPELDPAHYGLSVWDFDRPFHTGGLPGTEILPLSEIIDTLREAYCGTVGIEYMHIQTPEEKRWIQRHVEGVSTEVSVDEKRHILERLNAAEAFETFLHLRYIGQKRFGLEGAESTIPFLDATLEAAARAGLSEVVFGMAHRGRLNVLANIVGKSYEEIFGEFEGNLDEETVQGSGDVKYHKGASGRWHGRDGAEIGVSLASNPSHLEAVDPVVEGIVRAKQDHSQDESAFSVLPLLIHGDAAFAGQGVVAETLNLSMLKGYKTGGTVHLVINNQLGFTTPPNEARSSVYPTDVAKMVQAPIFHVNGDDPEACVRVARLAFAFRQAFHKDVVIDLVCYRRHGHNEGDDPSYTQPIMYKKIDEHRSVRTLYTEALVGRGDITVEDAEQALADFSARLQSALDETRSAAPPKIEQLPSRSLPKAGRLALPTGVDRSVLDRIAERLWTTPSGFTVHPKLVRQLEHRAAMWKAGEVDWALAEALAFGTLLKEGNDVRVTGQDTRRGTFSQRHSVLVDYESGREFIPLEELGERVGDKEPLIGEPRLGSFFIRDSLLSEYAALGFEYGYSVESVEALVAWEAQFGDFANGAQIVIDNFIVAAEEKWGQTSGIVLLLPHGYEGQGAEHSSARLERFLTLAAGENITVAQPTSAAQYFHLLRAQVKRPVHRPLVVMTPKSLLRSRFSRSSVEALVAGRFAEVLDDPARGESFDTKDVRRIILCSGRIAQDAYSRRDALIDKGVGSPRAIVRVEQLYPWPEAQLVDVLDRYSGAKRVIWLQDEP